jgi:hypothetical protein
MLNGMASVSPTFFASSSMTPAKEIAPNTAVDTCFYCDDIQEPEDMRLQLARAIKMRRL